MKKFYRGIRPDDLHGRTGLRNPERGLRNEIYFSTIPGEIAGVCSCMNKQMKLDGRPEVPVYQNADIPDVPHLIRGNRLELQWAEIAVSNGELRAEVEIINRGFSAPVNPRTVYLTLQNRHERFDLPFDVDIRKLYGGEKHTLKLAYPAEKLSPGCYRAGLSVPDPAPGLKDIPEYAIRCANAVDFVDGINDLEITVEI